MDLFQVGRQRGLIARQRGGAGGRVLCEGDEFEACAVCFGGKVYFVGDGDEETRVDCSFGREAYGCGGVGFDCEGGLGGCGECEVDTGVGGCAAFAGVVKVLDQGGEGV